MTITISKSIALWAGAFLLSLGVFLPYQATSATSVVVSGRVYNASTGAGISGVGISLCSGGANVTTSASGSWQALVPAGSVYCARLVSGAPHGLSGPATLNRPGVAAATTYENQLAGVNCPQGASCAPPFNVWDRSLDNNTDFIFRTPPSSVPAPSPRSQAISASAGPVAAANQPPAPTATPLAVDAPSSFSATAGSAPDVINLAWSAVTGASYMLERSLDQTTWSSVNSALSTTSYSDIGLKPSVTYYYHLTAQVGGAKASPVSASAMTAAASTSGVPVSTFASDDGVATATIPQSLVPAGATCSVYQSSATPVVGGTRSLTRSYQLTCSMPSGQTLEVSDSLVSWRLTLTQGGKSQAKPQAVGVTNDPKRSSLESSYDAQNGILEFKAARNLPVAAVAPSSSVLWLNLAAAGAVLLLVVCAWLFLPLRKQRRLNYQEYLRRKYYNV